MANKNPDQAIAIFGATSAVAQALAKLHAAEKHSILLIGRNTEHLESIANDLKVRGAKQVECVSVDLAKTDEHPNLFQQLSTSNNNISKYYFFYGVLPDQAQCETSWQQTYQALNTNFISKVSLLTLLANKIENEKNRSLIVVSSVAGDRGRQSNYVYGTSKGALTIFLQGLRNRLQKADCNVVTVKPGFIDTPMTQEFDKNFLWASPDKVAKDIFYAANKKRDVIYTPWFWRYIMLIIKSIPEPVFKKLSL